MVLAVPSRATSCIFLMVSSLLVCKPMFFMWLFSDFDIALSVSTTIGGIS